MIRIYCDSNIYRYLKPGHPSYNPELTDVFEVLKDKMLFTFSDAHLDDLKNSDFKYAEQDLLLMGNYVKDNYFMHDFIDDKQTGPYLATPLEAFSGKDYNAYENTLNNPFDTDNLFNGLDDFPQGKLMKQLMTSFLDMPVGLLSGQHSTADIKPSDKALLDKVFPNYNPMMSFRELMDNMWPFSKSLLQNKKEFKEFRKLIAAYMDREEYSFEKWGMAFNERFKNSTLGKSYMDTIENMLVESQKKDLYQKFNHAYTMLEIYNITKERQGKSAKGFNMQSLHTDALHAWYASFSDYLVTDDKGLQVKASIVYQLLGLHTKILSSKEFVNHKTILLGQEENLPNFLASLSHDLKHSMQLYESVDPFKNELVNTFKPQHPYFNYFNRYQVINSDGFTFIAFYCDRESHASFVLYREIELLVAKLNAMLGPDVDNRGGYLMEENNKYEEDEYIRKWVFNGMHFRLLKASKSWGNTICLGLELME